MFENKKPPTIFEVLLQKYDDFLANRQDEKKLETLKSLWDDALKKAETVKDFQALFENAPPDILGSKESAREELAKEALDARSEGMNDDEGEED